ncbi:hypothetical protein NEOLI_004967 [Neolecta irregularis DAH-3]|uniref:Myb-like domain-containing protein n=1 Tax=Neolecta irregularis (strain DAH-3) TaxID=1198029 RepID=A0A1U7LST0_NEOID|nr:hypothetical protein NEOLI_004967 [Neolecta irregularis DAH-3]|eukprot:OLL25704.1 hypothetical protein NEOLI_004967 [Neolecta irregularis DAH-3]
MSTMKRKRGRPAGIFGLNTGVGPMTNKGQTVAIISSRNLRTQNKPVDYSHRDFIRKIKALEREVETPKIMNQAPKPKVPKGISPYRRYTQEEDMLLFERRENNESFEKISKEYFPKRSPAALAKRFQKLKQCFENDEEIPYFEKRENTQNMNIELIPSPEQHKQIISAERCFDESQLEERYKASPSTNHSICVQNSTNALELGNEIVITEYDRENIMNFIRRKVDWGIIRDVISPLAETSALKKAYFDSFSTTGEIQV